MVDVGRRELQPPTLRDPCEEAVGPAVRVAGDHHVVAGTAERAQQGVLGGEPAGEREPVPAAFERGEAFLQRVAGRVGAAAVLVPEAGRADRVLRVGAGLVDRRHDRSGSWVGILPGVDGERVEAVCHWRNLTAATVDGVSGCVFCAIVAGSVPAFEVASTDSAIAFLDTRPVFKGHTLVAPRAHVVTLAELPVSELSTYFGFVRAIAVAVEAGLGAGGTFVAINNKVSQSVPHLHTHVVPRTKGDGLRGFFWPRTKYPSDEEAKEYAARVAAALSSSI